MVKSNDGPGQIQDVRSALRVTLKRLDVDYWREVDKARVFPTKAFEVMGEAGYFGTPAWWSKRSTAPGATPPASMRR